MTERERLLEKIRKVQALANRGADGEKQSAAALLDRLMTQYGIDEAEIAEERLEKCFFRYQRVHGTVYGTDGGKQYRSCRRGGKGTRGHQQAR